MSSVTIINTGGSSDYATGGSNKKKDSSSALSRGIYAVGGLAATGAGASGLYTALRIDDRFSMGEAGKFLQKQPVIQQFKSWRELIKHHPQGGQRGIWGMGIASAVMVSVGLHWLKKAFTDS